MKILIPLLFIAGCTTSPVTQKHWQQCVDVCASAGNGVAYHVDEACVHFWKGKLCKCMNGDLIRLDQILQPYLQDAY